MKTYLNTLGLDLCDSVMMGYTTPTTPSTNAYTMVSRENNTKAMDAILSTLPNYVIVKVKEVHIR